MVGDSEGDQHVFSTTQTPGTCLCDGQRGSHATLAIPDLDMVDTRPADTEQEEEEAPPLVLPFSHPRCDDPSITGGKGASLGGIHLFYVLYTLRIVTISIFISWSGKLSKHENVSVPRGLCITTRFFDQFVDEELRMFLLELQRAVFRQDSDQKDLESYCLAVQQKIMRHLSR